MKTTKETDTLIALFSAVLITLFIMTKIRDLFLDNIKFLYSSLVVAGLLFFIIWYLIVSFKANYKTAYK